MYDYGARMYILDIGRWGVLHPKNKLLESSSPNVYALNSPIFYLDRDIELSILINGFVNRNDTQRGNYSYWDSQILKTMGEHGFPNPGEEFQYVGGDRYYIHDINMQI